MAAGSTSVPSYGRRYTSTVGDSISPGPVCSGRPDPAQPAVPPASTVTTALAGAGTSAAAKAARLPSALVSTSRVLPESRWSSPCTAPPDRSVRSAQAAPGRWPARNRRLVSTSTTSVSPAPSQPSTCAGPASVTSGSGGRAGVHDPVSTGPAG